MKGGYDENYTDEKKELLTFTVEVTEVLSRLVEVQAYSEDDAIEKVSHMYNNEEIILDGFDMYDTTFEIN